MSDTTPIPPASERERFEAWCRENYLCSEHSFARAPDGYAHVVSHRVLRGCYANVQMLWEAFRDARAALSHPSTPQGWQPIGEAPECMDRQVLVFWIDSEGNEQTQFDHTEDGCWMEWHNHAEHVEIIGGHGVSYAPPYTHWMPLPPPPEQGGKG